MTSPLDIACPHCNEPAGQPCRVPGGQKTVPHARRRGAKPTPGRQPILDPEQTDQICELLEMGVPLLTAAQSVRLSSTTLYRWLAMADNPETPNRDAYAEFRERVLVSRARGSIEYVKLLHSAAKGGQLLERTVRSDPQGGETVTEKYAAAQSRAAEFMLERAFGRDWARRQVIELSATDELDPTEAAKAAQSEIPGVDAVGVNRLLTHLDYFKEQRAIDSGEIQVEQIENNGDESEREM